MGDYNRLKVYEKSYEVAKEIYELSKKLPREERYGLTSQIRRAATSIPLNIAEGDGKQDGEKELLRFLKMAQGSCSETEVLLRFIKDFGYISEEEYEKYNDAYCEIGKMLSGLRRSLCKQN